MKKVIGRILIGIVLILAIVGVATKFFSNFLYVLSIVFGILILIGIVYVLKKVNEKTVDELVIKTEKEIVEKYKKEKEMKKRNFKVIQGGKK